MITEIDFKNFQKVKCKYIKFNNFSDFIDYIRQNNYDKKYFVHFIMYLKSQCL